MVTINDGTGKVKRKPSREFPRLYALKNQAHGYHCQRICAIMLPLNADKV